MPYADHPIPKAEFNAIFAKVPRLTVDLIVRNPAGALYFTKRDIEPCAGLWHLPGGTIRYGEPVLDAVKRLAARELSIKVKHAELKDYLDYPSHYLHGLGSPVGLVFEISKYTGHPSPDSEAKAAGWFRELPQPMHADQDAWLIAHNYCSK